ncbi:hypothetical protein QVD17_09148 [Tagetes erecta]|uniref:C2 domain-containing protein n=1 Tax=Tagetes erecta TaxID=13708 RepID=A0AAD8L0E1_TARER|nr:hypothetical protein QVD17_09148 [Tagetes erecta]
MVSKTCTTDVAKKAGSCPVWNHRMVFNVNPLKKDCILFCEMHHDGKLSNRKIGEVQVPLSEFLAGDGSSKKVSYPVKTVSGEIKGDIVISYKLLEPGVTKDGSGTGKKEGSTGNPKDVKKDSVPKKKKDGFMKFMAKGVAVNVASKVVMLAGVAGIAYGATLFAEDETGSNEHPEGQTEDGNQAGDDQAVDENQVEDQTVDENQVEDQTVDADEDVDVDQDDGYDDEDGYDDGDDYGDDVGF